MNGKKERRGLVFVVHVEGDEMPTLKAAVIESFEHHIREIKTEEYARMDQGFEIGSKGKRDVNSTTSYYWQTLKKGEVIPDLRLLVQNLVSPMDVIDSERGIDIEP